MEGTNGMNANIMNLFAGRATPLLVGLAAISYSQSAAAATLADLSEGDLVITEIMADPTKVTDDNGEWFEIYNDSGLDVALDGLVLSDMGTDSQTISTTVVLSAGGTALFASKSAKSVNGGMAVVDVKFTRTSFQLENGADELVLSYGSVIFDSVAWTKTVNKVMAGMSFSLDPDHLDATLNDRDDYWCYSSSLYNSVDAGTPRSANDSCGIASLMASELTAGDLVITEVMVDPTKVDDALGEWVEIYNPTGGDVNLNGLILKDKDSDSVTVSSDVMMYIGDRVLLSCKGISAKNGGLPTVDYVYSRTTFKFDNTADEVYLANASGNIDEVKWTKPPATGSYTAAYSLSLDPDATDATSNDDAANWCNASSMYNSLDYGTPGDANDACP